MSTAFERVQEYLRQRKPQNKDLGNVIHNIWTDPRAEMASLTIEDLDALIAAVDAVLELCTEMEAEPSSELGTIPGVGAIVRATITDALGVKK